MENPTKIITRPWSTVKIFGRTSVEKTYDPIWWKQGYAEQFDKEIAFHKKLEGCLWKPQLVCSNRSKRWLKMKYVGTKLTPYNLPPDWQDQVEIIYKDLKRRGLTMVHLVSSNIRVYKGRIYLVDMASLSRGECDPTVFENLIRHVLGQQDWPGGILTPEKYDSIRSSWKGDVYQTWGNQLTGTLRHVECLDGLDVLDIGCNAGLTTWVISQYANSVCGIERNPHYHAQALQTAKFITKPHEFLCGDLANLLPQSSFQANAAFASHVLYLLDDAAVEAIRTQLLPRCKVVLFVSREDKNRVRSAGGIKNKLYTHGAIKQFLTASGMKVECFDEGTNWVSVIGRR